MIRFPLRAGLVALAVTAIPAETLAAGQGTYPIVDTGQTTHFNDKGTARASSVASSHPGQDADYDGNEPSYRDNGDSTITDLVTGLMWQKDFSKSSWQGAQDGAATATTGGHDDWRVPTIKELYSLIAFSGNQGSGNPSRSTAPRDAVPFLDSSVFAFEYPDKNRYIDAQYVTSTLYTSTVMNGTSCFFGVNFADGRIKCYPIRPSDGDDRWYVRYVRGNPDYGQNAYVDNGDGTVTDAATGLMWSEVDSGNAALAGDLDGAMTWSEALKFAEASTYAGHDDWRLPNAKELQSLVDYTRSPDATGSAAIDPVFSVTSVENAAGNKDWPEFWSSTSFAPGSDAVVVYFGRAMGYFSAGGRPAAFMDVHGAGAQRTDPKTGSDSYGNAPQGDVRYTHNFVRLVRDAD